MGRIKRLNPKLIKMIESDEFLIRRFCQEYSVRLIDIRENDESEVVEPLYIFSDNLGGYTRAGINESLNR